MASTTHAMHFNFEPPSSIDCYQLPRCCLSIFFWVSPFLVGLGWVIPVAWRLLGLHSGFWWWNGQSTCWYRPARYVWVNLCFFCPSTLPCIIVCVNVPGRPVTWPNHCKFHLLITSISGSYSPTRPLILCTTVLLVTLCFQMIPGILWKQRISYAITRLSTLLLRVQASQPYSATEVTSDLINFTLVESVFDVTMILLFSALFPLRTS